MKASQGLERSARRRVAAPPDRGDGGGGRQATVAWLPWVALTIVYAVWGSTYLGLRVGVETLPPLLMAGTRFFTAGLLLYPFARVRGNGDGTRERVGLAQWRAAAIVGVLLLGIANAAVGWAEQTVPSGLAALVVATVTIWFVLFDRLVNGARMGRLGLLGVALGFAGVALLVRPTGSHSIDLFGVGVIMAGAISWASGSLYSKRAPLPANALLGAAMQMLVAGALLLVVSAASGELDGFSLAQVSGRSLIAWVWLVVAGSVIAYSAYTYALKTLPTATVATYAYVNPVIAVLLGVGILDERVTGQMLLAGVVIVAAVALIVSGQRQRTDGHGRH